MKTPMIFVAAVLLGLTSTALATDPFGLHAYQPAFHGNELGARMLLRPQTGRSMVFAAMQPLAVEEGALFDRTSRPE